MRNCNLRKKASPIDNSVRLKDVYSILLWRIWSSSQSVKPSDSEIDQQRRVNANDQQRLLGDISAGKLVLQTHRSYLGLVTIWPIAMLLLRKIIRCFFSSACECERCHNSIRIFTKLGPKVQDSVHRASQLEPAARLLQEWMETDRNLDSLFIRNRWLYFWTAIFLAAVRVFLWLPDDRQKVSINHW
jgi:hypothetical protein